jgi:hypothetical protein
VGYHDRAASHRQRCPGGVSRTGVVSPPPAHKLFEPLAAFLLGPFLLRCYLTRNCTAEAAAASTLNRTPVARRLQRPRPGTRSRPPQPGALSGTCTRPFPSVLVMACIRMVLFIAGSYFLTTGMLDRRDPKRSSVSRISDRRMSNPETASSRRFTSCGIWACCTLLWRERQSSVAHALPGGSRRKGSPDW